jgi:hypothetical protein
MMTEGSDEDGYYRMHTQLGTLEVEVEGDDPAWVAEQFADRWREALADAEDMSDAVRDGDRRFQ